MDPINHKKQTRENQRIVDEFAKLIAGQQEDILKGFIAKYGMQAGEQIAQVKIGNAYTVVKWTPDEYGAVRSAFLTQEAMREFTDTIMTLISGMKDERTATSLEISLEKEAVEAMEKLKALLGLNRIVRP